MDAFLLFFQSDLVIGEVNYSLKLEGVIVSKLVEATFEGVHGGCYDNTCRQRIPLINDTLCEVIGFHTETGSFF